MTDILLSFELVDWDGNHDREFNISILNTTPEELEAELTDTLVENGAVYATAQAITIVKDGLEDAVYPISGTYPAPPTGI